MSVYLIIMSQNKFIHRDKLTYPYNERGLQFGDGVYEVIRVYDGTYYLLDEHINRLFRSLQAIKIDVSFTKSEMKYALQEILKRNSMEIDGMVYLQVTRGSAPRIHSFPDYSSPNFYAYAKDFSRPLSKLEKGVSTIIHPDERWENCYIKSLNLLPNVLAKQAAKESECFEAILQKDGRITEGSSSNLFMIRNGKIYTHPATKHILHGCVRMRVKTFASNLSIPFIEEAFLQNELASADELFLTSTTSEIMPIIKVNHDLIADGKPGPITRKLQTQYNKDAHLIVDSIKHLI